MMRFLTGFLGGATVTSSVFYFTVITHWQTRTAQRALVQQQIHALSRLCEADGQGLAPLPIVRDGHYRAGLMSSLRDRWNDRLAGLATMPARAGASRN